MPVAHTLGRYLVTPVVDALRLCLIMGAQALPGPVWDTMDDGHPGRDSDALYTGWEGGRGLGLLVAKKQRGVWCRPWQR